ncbi:DUF6233 domain-containing protein [Streptomyces goshikiensis]|uniref:DUF6233 domain-containing protein n=1 Tax=Streptomyces goshikiensis TaxID=1942 RepID=UPI0036FC374A
MSVLPPDLPRLRTLVTYLRGELSRTEQALASAEECDAATARKQAQPAPESPAWLVERGIGVGRLPVRVHTGDCWDTRSRCTPAGADQIRALLAQGIPACPHCRPDTALRPRVVVHPPDAQGGRRVRTDGEILGRALNPRDLLEFLRRAGPDPDSVRLDDPLLIEWRGGGPAVWSSETEGV